MPIFVLLSAQKKISDYYYYKTFSNQEIFDLNNISLKPTLSLNKSDLALNYTYNTKYKNAMYMIVKYS